MKKETKTSPGPTKFEFLLLFASLLYLVFIFSQTNHKKRNKHTRYKRTSLARTMILHTYKKRAQRSVSTTRSVYHCTSCSCPFLIMSGPIEQNSSGGPTSPPENSPEITTQEEQEAIASVQQVIQQVIGDDDSDDGDDGDDDDDDHGDDDDEDDEEDFLAQLPPSIRGRVDELKKLNVARDDFIEGYLKERAALEQKYYALCEPLFDQRKAIINGQGDKEEIQPADAEPENENEEVAGIPEFWNVAMSNIETIDDLVTERDAECLNFLEDITCQDLPTGLGFTLKFHFKPNPYFSNSFLSKRYDVPNLLLVDDEPILKNVTGCEIDWKDSDMCLMHRVVSKKQRNKKGQIRQVKKKERTESFFHFFR